MHPVTCAGLSFVATASLLIWDVLDDPGPAPAAATSFPAAPPRAWAADLLCDDPRTAHRREPQVLVWTHNVGATCP